jgi:polysaccharide biosynthesis protein PslH
MRIAFVSARVPYPLNTGGRIRTFHLLRAAAAVHDVTLVTAVESVSEAANLRALRDALPALHVEAVRVLPRHARGALVSRAAMAPFDPLPFAWAGFRDPRFVRNVWRVLARTPVDLVHCDHVQVAHALPSAGAPRIVNAHNVENVAVRRLADNERRPWRRALLGWEARKTEGSERATYATVDHCLAVSATDAAKIEALVPGLRVTVVPNGVDVKAFAVPDTAPDRNLVVFVGSMDWSPNVEGVMWFARQVVPAIRRMRPTTSFLVVGRRPARRLIRALRQADVRCTGTVDDVRPFIERAAVVVVPLLSGSGTRLKILEAWAMGKAVVSTRVGAEGLPAEHAVNALVIDGAFAFAHAVTQLLDDEQTAVRLGANGRKTVEESFSWERVAESLLAAYTDTVNGRRL